MDLQLGIPDFTRALTPHGSVYDSRVGGLAHYFERGAAGAVRASPAPSLAGAETPPPAHPSCALCRSPLFLLLQLYAPAERERSLLLYGCNAVACKGGPGAWVARRTQGGPVAEAAGGGGDGAPPPPSAEPADPWGAASAWDSVGGGEFGDGNASAALAEGPLWGGAPAAAAPPPLEPSGPPPAPAPFSVEAASFVHAPRFPAHPVDTVFEDAAVEAEAAADTDSSGDEGGAGRSVGGGRGGGGGGGGSFRAGEWEHAQRLLERYQAEAAAGGDAAAGEAGAEAVAAAEAAAGAALGAAALAGGGEDASNEVEEEGGGEATAGEEEEEEGGGAQCGGGGAVAAAAAPSGGGGRNKGRGRLGGGGGGCEGGGERYERAPAAVRKLQRFHTLLAQVPGQALRYLWDAPEHLLWPLAKPLSALPPPPPCEACGASRRLELQVLPPLLYGLRVEEHALGAGAGGKAAALLGGMDYLTVLVFSCEASCADGGEEWPLVVMPRE
jgi:hypothetical protein